MGSLDGKVAFISGVARGQGRSHAIRLAREGANIIGFDSLTNYDSLAYDMSTESDMDTTVRMVEKTGSQMLGLRADVRCRTEVNAVLQAGLQEFGRVDIVCANAGIFPKGAPFWELAEDSWNDVIDVNLTGVFHTCAVAVPTMISQGNGGSIIVTSSGAGIKAMQNLADYNSSKFGVIGLAKTMANELAAFRIRANAICPGTVRTDLVLNEGLYRLFRPDLDAPGLDDVMPLLTAINPIAEPWLEPEDISDAVAWLASDQSRFVTGITLPIDLGIANKAM
jgi:(+)-trans-carveol dehydrogenase